MPEDGSPISKDDVQAAASVGRLTELARQLVLDEGWVSVEVLFTFAGGQQVSLEDVIDCVLSVRETITAMPESRSLPVAPELSVVKRLAAQALVRKVRTADGDQTLTVSDRRALELAADLMFELGEMRRAAETFERAGSDGRAAEAYGALGALEKMELCLTRDEQGRARRHAAADAVRRFEVLVAAGERVAALQSAAGVPDDHPDGRTVRAQAREIEGRLCRGRAVTLSLPDGRRLRMAGVPAVLGRDGLGQVVLRDPSVSRRHAIILAGPDGTLAIEDAGSRTGTRIAGTPIAGRVALGESGTIGLGDHCQVNYQQRGPGVVMLSGAAGLDRGLLAIVGGDPLPMSIAVPGAEGVLVSFDNDGARLRRVEGTRVRVGGRLIGHACDLLVGDVIEVGDGGVRLEVT